MKPKERRAVAKSPIQFALERIATPDTRDLVLKLTHGVITTAMKKAILEGEGKNDDARVAADARSYARMLHEIETELGTGFSNLIHAPRTIRTTPDRLPSRTASPT